jgi:hypothetical protein
VPDGDETFRLPKDWLEHGHHPREALSVCPGTSAVISTAIGYSPWLRAYAWKWAAGSAKMRTSNVQ